MASIGVKGSAKACALRVARLAADCTTPAGATNGVATSAIIRLASTPTLEAGDTYQLKNGCGTIVVRQKDPDSLIEMGLSLDLATRDFELIELLTGASLVNNAEATPKAIGFSRRGIGAAAPSYVSLEVWTTAIDASGVCVVGAAGTSWYRVIYPRATFVLGDNTIENGVATVSMTGFATNNPVWGNGPWNDFPGTPPTLSTTSPETIVFDNGPPTLQNGYIAVPTQT